MNRSDHHRNRTGNMVPNDHPLSKVGEQNWEPPHNNSLFKRRREWGRENAGQYVRTRSNRLLRSFCFLLRGGFCLRKYFWAWLATWVGVLVVTKRSEIPIQSPFPISFSPAKNFRCSSVVHATPDRFWDKKNSHVQIQKSLGREKTRTNWFSKSHSIGICFRKLSIFYFC